MSEIITLKVFLYDTQIGTLSLLPNQKTIFVFNDSYIDNPSRPTLSLSFKDQFGDLITDIKPTRAKLPPFFSNVLPEGHLREYLAEQAGINKEREFFLISHLGKDLPGALKVSSIDEVKFPNEKPQSNSELTNSNLLHFSLAGIQLKFSAVMESTGGLTIPAEGVGGQWILKLPSIKYKGVPENEFSMMKIAKLVGMDIPDVKLVAPDKITGLPNDIGEWHENALAIKRFDRTDSGPVHIEDFAQVFDVYPDKKYEKASYKNIAEVLWIETGEEGIAEFIKRLVFNTLIGNADMHLKNWSLIYKDKIHPELSPGYDFVSTISYLPDEKMALNYVNTKLGREFSLELLSHFAAKANLPESLVLSIAKETTKKFLDVWHSEKKNLPLTSKVILAIQKNYESVPLVEEVFK